MTTELVRNEERFSEGYCAGGTVGLEDRLAQAEKLYNLEQARGMLSGRASNAQPHESGTIVAGGGIAASLGKNGGMILG